MSNLATSSTCRLRHVKRSEAPAFLLERRKLLSRKRPTAKPIRADGDTGSLELRNHHTVILEARKRTSTGHVASVGARVIDQIPLDRYYLRKQLSPDKTRNDILFTAGTKLRNDFYYSGLQLHTMSRFEPATSRSTEPLANIKISALQAYKSAMNHVSQTLRPILVHVCCLQDTAQDWASRNGQQKDAGITVLRLALEELAIHYGMLKVNT